ncbi:MAG: WD40/YVTN/BNR-like repeat-containing protein [Longimicrobiales bacterium]
MLRLRPRRGRKAGGFGLGLGLGLIGFAAAPAAGAAQAPEGELTSELLSAFTARPIGPANQSGRVTAISAPDTIGHKVMYAGFATGGVWKTTNGGVTWRPIFDEQGFGSIADVVVAPSDPRVVWVGTGERNSLRSQGWGDGVYRSTDAGASWSHVGLEETREIGRIAVDPRDADVAYVAALGHLWGANEERGLYKTTDGGETWETVLFVDDTTGFIDVKLHPSNPDIVYAASWHRLRWGGGRMEGAGAGSAVWKSTDGGASWTRLSGPGIDRGLPAGPLGRIGLGVSPADPDVVYAVIQAAYASTDPSISPFGGLFRSQDAGESWTRVNDSSAVPDYYYNEVWVDPSDADRLYLAGTFLGYSEDGGRGIETLRLGDVHVDHHAMWIDPDDGDHLVLGNDGGLYTSFDAAETWWHHPMPLGQFYEISVDSTKTPYHVCGGLQDNGTWCGPSRTREERGITAADWYTIFGGDGFVSHVSVDSPWIRYGESQFGNIARLNTRTWERTSIQPHAEDEGVESGDPFRWDWNTPFVISHHDPTVLYLGGNYLFRMTDRGESWTIIGPDMTRQSLAAPEPMVEHTPYGALHSIAESRLDPGVIWTGSSGGLLWVTSDAGETWTRLTERIPDETVHECTVAEIEASPHDRATAFVVYDCHKRDGYGAHVFRTTDLGGSFTEITGDLPADAGSYVVRQDPVEADLLYVGNERGLYISNDRGEHWVRFTEGLPTSPVRDIDFGPGAHELAIGAYGRSVYILPLDALRALTPETLAGDAALLPVADVRMFEERDTYASSGEVPYAAPNPPQAARITYYLAEDQGDEIRLRIRRLGENGAGDDGDVVQTLTGSGRPGTHTLEWDLELDEPRPHRLGDPADSDELSTALPGRYSVSLEIGGRTMTETFTVEDGWIEETPGAVR